MCKQWFILTDDFYCTWWVQVNMLPSGDEHSSPKIKTASAVLPSLGEPKVPCARMRFSGFTITITIIEGIVCVTMHHEYNRHYHLHKPEHNTFLVCIWEDDNNNNYNVRVTSLASWKDTSPTTPAPPSTTPLPRYRRLSAKKWSWLCLENEHKYHTVVYMDYNDATQACRDMVKEWDRRDASRRKALSQLQTKSPLPHASRFGGHPIQGWLLSV